MNELQRAPWGPIQVGHAKITDDTGLDWIIVVAANEYGDCPVGMYPANPPGMAQAEGHADQLLSTFEILGLAAERGEVSMP